MARRLNTLWTLRAACALLAACGIAALSSCGSSSSSAGPGGGFELTVLDGAGNRLPAGVAQLEPVAPGDVTPDSDSGAAGTVAYAIRALDSGAAGFRLSYPQDMHVVRVERGGWFAAGDLFLAATGMPGRIDIGGYSFSRAGSGAARTTSHGGVEDGDEIVPDTGADHGGAPDLTIPNYAADATLVARVVLAPGPVRHALSLPTDSSCTPAGFGYSDNGDDSASFHWSYHNTGDYNQDGEVNISDLTPVGASFHMKSTDSGWPAASLADGDGNGEVNISDITPIGVNYATLISGYKLEQSGAQSGPFNETTSLGLAAGVKSPALAFSYIDTSAVDGRWYRVRVFNDADPASGAATDPLQISLVPAGDAPVADFTYTPPAPLAGELVSFSDASTGADSLDWDFGDGGLSTVPFPTHTYIASGTYTVTLTATNVHGSRQASQQVSVSDPLPVYGPEDTFVEQSSATLSGPGTAFNINSTDLPDGTNILFGPITQGMPPADNHLVLTWPYRGGLDDPASPHPNVRTALGYLGMTVAGMVIYGPSNDSTITVSGTQWHYDANSAKINGEDPYGGHASPVNGGQYHYHDVAFITDNSWVGVDGFDGIYTWADGHSKLIGWAEDGYPIYGPYGYVDPLDPGSGVAKMSSSWLAGDTGANRPADVVATTASAANNSVYVVLTSDPGGLGINPGMHVTEINGAPPATDMYVVNQQNITYAGGGHPPYMGPANGIEMNKAVDVPGGATVKLEFLPGIFIEDNAYTGAGTLDRYNGRWCVTPDYPGGTYAYFCTMDAAGAGVYPYMIGPELYGSTSVGSTPGTGYVRPTQ